MAPIKGDDGSSSIPIPPPGRYGVLGDRSIVTVATRPWTGWLRTLVAAAWFGLGVAGGAANAAVILVVEDAENFVHRLDQNGVNLGGFVLGGDVDFDRGDGFAAGHILLPDHDSEILVVEDAEDTVFVHKPTGDLVHTFQLGVDVVEGHEFAVGDVDGDGTAEILVARSSSAHILDQNGRPISSILFDVEFGEGDEFEVADVDGDRKAEVLIIEDDGDRVDVFDATNCLPSPRPALCGRPKGRFQLEDTDFDRGDAIAVGNFDGDREGTAEILVIEDDGDVVDVLDARTGLRKGRFQLQGADFDSGDGFAVIF